MADAIIIDGSALVNSLCPRTSKTFEEYATLDVLTSYKGIRQSIRGQALCLMFTIHQVWKLKHDQSEEGGAWRWVTSNEKIPSNWPNFLSKNYYKTELFIFLADKIAEMFTANVITATREKDAVNNRAISLEGVPPPPCSQEEVASRGQQGHHGQSMWHGCYGDSRQLFPGLKALGLQTAVDCIWASNVRWIPVGLHDLAVALGPDKTSGILFFHSFTGCDVVSAFRGKYKTSAWQTWDVWQIFWTSNLSIADRELLTADPVWMQQRMSRKVQMLWL